MKRKYKIFQIDAFATKSFEGNPAGVTFGEDFSDEEMQLISKEMNLSETAFLTSSEKADYKLRWFTPQVEVDLCGHATIASLHFLKELNKIKNRKKITFETRSGVLNCPVEDEYYMMEIPVPQIERFECCREEIISALNIERISIPDEYEFILVNNAYLYIYCDSLEALKNTQPNFSELLQVGNKNGFKAAVIFTLETFDKESFAHSRFFAPAYGINEDPVTGSANGPLIIVLKELGLLNKDENEITKTFEQGDIIGRKGRVKVTHLPKTGGLFIGGTAVTVLIGDLYI